MTLSSRKYACVSLWYTVAKLRNLSVWRITGQNIRAVYSVGDKGMNELLCIWQIEICFKSQNILQVIIDLNNKPASVQRIYWSQKTLCSVKQHLGIKCTSVRKKKPKTNIPKLSNISDALELLRKPNYKFIQINKWRFIYIQKGTIYHWNSMVWFSLHGYNTDFGSTYLSDLSQIQ